jgi:hypothetical protein
VALDVLSLSVLDGYIRTCSPTARAYRALVDIDANQQSSLLSSLLSSLVSAIRVEGRLGYIGDDRRVDVTASAIGLEALSRANADFPQMTGMLASFVGQTVESKSNSVMKAIQYGFGDQQIAYSLLALSSFDLAR